MLCARRASRELSASARDAALAVQLTESFPKDASDFSAQQRALQQAGKGGQEWWSIWEGLRR